MGNLPDTALHGQRFNYRRKPNSCIRAAEVRRG